MEGNSPKNEQEVQPVEHAVDHKRFEMAELRSILKAKDLMLANLMDRIHDLEDRNEILTKSLAADSQDYLRDWFGTGNQEINLVTEGYRKANIVAPTPSEWASLLTDNQNLISSLNQAIDHILEVSKGVSICCFCSHHKLNRGDCGGTSCGSQTFEWSGPRAWEYKYPLKCSYPPGIAITSGGVPVDPCLYEEKAVYQNVTIRVAQCNTCGTWLTRWEHQDNTICIYDKITEGGRT